MKKVISLVAGLFFLMLSFNAAAQTKSGADYFTGKWNVVVKGTPDGDAKMTFILERSGDKITGAMQDSTGKEITKITEAEVKGDEVTLYFNTQGYDLNLQLKKKDDNKATGSLLGMFDAEADRVKEVKTK